MHCKMEERIIFKIGKASHKLHMESLDIPCAATQLHIDVVLPGELRYMGFILAEDPDKNIRLQKLLGYGEQRLGIGESVQDTTIGGVPGRIQAGSWRIGLGIFTEYVEHTLGERTEEITVIVSDKKEKISDPIDGECWVVKGLCISEEKYMWDKVYGEEKRWYKGDFHTHTRLSDGKESIASAVHRAEQVEMDFYVPTEHNLMHTGWCKTSLCILPGIEVTTDKGHMNVFGIQKMPERIFDIVAHNGEAIVDSYVEDVIFQAKQEGWILSINHPFLTIWRWRYSQTKMQDIDCIEIINDPTYPDGPPSNDMAIRFLDTVWKEGHRIWGIGGSDSHNLENELYEGAVLPSAAGDPGTWVFCPSLTPRNLMESVKEGHICVTRFCRIEPEIYVGREKYLPGSRITDRACTVIYKAEVTGLDQEPDIFLVLDGEYKKLPVANPSPGIYSIRAELDLAETLWQWFRLEARSSGGDFLGYVNPVWRGNKVPKLKTFGEILKKAEGSEND